MTLSDLRRSGVVAVSIALVLLATACGGGGDTVAVDETTSTTTAPAAGISFDELAEDYCARAEQLSAAGALRLDEDPALTASGMGALTEVAPPSLRADLERVTAQLVEVSGVATADPSGAVELLDLLLDAEFLASLDRVEQATSDQCGVDLGAGRGVDPAGD